jgi:excisionase family DNA binding protein
MSGDRMNAPPTPAVVRELSAPATSWDPYLSIKTLSNYSSLSARLLRSFLTASEHPLPHYRVGSRVLVKRSDFDGWIQMFRHEESDPEAIAERILMSLDARPRVSQSRTA